MSMEDTILEIARAKREGSHALISMEGGSGTGKTYSAILLGRGLVGPSGKLALLDTETGRGKIYANLAGGYDYAELTAPFTPERYIAAIRQFEANGYECLIIDSASHEWEGIGGVNEIAENGKSQSGAELKGLVKWAKPKARHKRFMQALLNTRMHVIVCLRVKEKLLQEGNTITSAGFLPVQEKNFSYEMTVRLFFPRAERTGIAPVLLKCPADLLGAFPDGQPVSIETGARIAEWVKGGEPIDAELATLKREAEEAAEQGTAALIAFGKRLAPAQAEKLKPYGVNLRSIAKQADEDGDNQ